MPTRIYITICMLFLVHILLTEMSQGFCVIVLQKIPDKGSAAKPLCDGMNHNSSYQLEEPFIPRVPNASSKQTNIF